MTNPSTAIQEYESQLQQKRQRFIGRLMPFFMEKDPRVLAVFLMNFCSQGVGMTEPVPDWIRRAGEKTKGRGFEELGTALVNHAVHEQDHHHMMIADTHSLVAWWNESYSPKLAAESFLQQSFSPGVRRYRQLHEDYIAGDTPFCQIAIEYEIEKISVDCGPKLFGYLAHTLGPRVLSCLSFVTEHTAIDVGHTQYNQRALGKFLDQTPESLGALVEAGAAALDCYASYLEDAMESARRYVRQSCREIRA